MLWAHNPMKTIIDYLFCPFSPRLVFSNIALWHQHRWPSKWHKWEAHVLWCQILYSSSMHKLMQIWYSLLNNKCECWFPATQYSQCTIQAVQHTPPPPPPPPPPKKKKKKKINFFQSWMFTNKILLNNINITIMLGYNYLYGSRCLRHK